MHHPGSERHGAFHSAPEPTQDGDGILDTGFADVHRLEAPLKCGIFLDVLSVLIERGGPDGPQLTRASCGLSILAASPAPSA